MTAEQLDARKQDLEAQLAVQADIIRAAERTCDAIRGALQDVAWWRAQHELSNGQAPLSLTEGP